MRKSAPAPGHVDGDGVAGDAGFRTGEQAILAEQAIDQRRLAAVRPPDHGDVDGRRLRGCIGSLGVALAADRASPTAARSAPAAPHAAHRRDRKAPPRARPRSRPARPGRAHRPRSTPACAVAALALVGDQDGGLAGSAHEIGEGAIDRGRAALRIDQEQHRVGSGNRGFGLRPHAAGQRRASGLFEAGGVDRREGEIAKACRALAAVAGDARAGRRPVRAVCRPAG